jgi:hypothetical protein
MADEKPAEGDTEPAEPAEPPRRSRHISLPRWLTWTAISSRVLDGSWGSFGFYCASAVVLFVFVLLTVNRHPETYLAQANVPSRTMGWLNAWHEHGFFRHAGLLIYPEEGWKVYKTDSGSYMWLPYLVNEIVRLFKGHGTFRSLSYFFQLHVALNAAVVGFLGMRLAQRIGTTAFHALVLGLSTTVVYQTFPMNLVGSFALNPLTPVVLFSAVFWILVENGGLDESSTKRQQRFVAASVFLLTMSYSIATSLFFVVAFVLAVGFLAPSTVRPRVFFVRVVLPLAAGGAFQQLQLLWIRLTLPNTNFIGNLNPNEFLWRSGLDGSQEYYTGVWDVLTRRWMSMGYIVSMTAPQTTQMMTWTTLFLVGVASVIANLIFFARSPKSRSTGVFLAGAIGLYLLSLFVFSQGVIIHPDCWDLLIVFPLVVSLFAILPAHVAARGKSTTGLPVLVALLGAFCLCFVQLRSFAITFPVPP